MDNWGEMSPLNVEVFHPTYNWLLGPFCSHYMPRVCFWECSRRFMLCSYEDLYPSACLHNLSLYRNNRLYTYITTNLNPCRPLLDVKLA